MGALWKKEAGISLLFSFQKGFSLHRVISETLTGAQGLFFVNDRFAEVIHDPAAHVHRPELDEEAEVLDVTGLPLHLLARLSFLKARRLVRPLEYCNRLEVLHLAPLPTYVGLGAALRGFQGLKEIRLDATHLQENTLALPAVTEQFRHLKHLEEITIVGLMVRGSGLLAGGWFISLTQFGLGDAGL